MFNSKSLIALPAINIRLKIRIMEKLLLILGTLALTLSIAYVSVPQTLSAQLVFREWQLNHGVLYPSLVQEQYRFNIFKENLDLIMNARRTDYTLGMNQFMDLTSEEFQRLYLINHETRSDAMIISKPQAPLVPVDWRDKGVLNPIRNQGKCGACWAFSSISAIETVKALKSGVLEQLSEQELIDCSSNLGNMGCQGGFMENAYKYAKRYTVHNIVDYPYSGHSQECQRQTPGGSITGYTKILFADCGKLEDKVHDHPIAVAVDATDWQFYASGIVENCAEGDLNHSALLVGVTQEAWILRNSWSQKWGEDGHIRLAKGNTCGVCEAASYPTV